MDRFLVAILIAAALATRSNGLTAQDDDLVVDDLRLDLALDFDEGSLAGTARLRVRNLGPAPVPGVSLLLGRLMQVVGVADETGPISFDQDVVRFSDWESMQVLRTRIDFRSPLGSGEGTEIEVEYGGVLVGYTETGMSYVRDRISPDFTLIRSDAYAFPTLGEASLASMRSRRRQDFTFSGSVTVADTALVLASVGHDGVEHDDGLRVWRFSSMGPAPFMLLALARYEVVETPVARIYHFPADESGAFRLGDALVKATGRYADWFGPRADTRRIVITEIPEGWGSQASLAGGIIQTADAFRSESALVQMYHEVAHLWHPREVERPPDRWNEGLATFLQWRLAHDGDSRALSEQMERTASRVVSEEESTAPPMSRYGETDRTDLAYRVGPLLFYLLHEAMGPGRFEHCLASFFDAFEETGSTTADFVVAVGGCGAEAEMVLDEWFATTAGLGRLRAGESLTELIASYRQGEPGRLRN